MSESTGVREAGSPSPRSNLLFRSANNAEAKLTTNIRSWTVSEHVEILFTSIQEKINRRSIEMGINMVLNTRRRVWQSSHGSSILLTPPSVVDIAHHGLVIGLVMLYRRIRVYSRIPLCGGTPRGPWERLRWGQNRHVAKDHRVNYQWKPPSEHFMAPFSIGHKLNFWIANIDDANNPIRYAFTEQATQEAFAFLLGGLPKIWRKREVEAGDDSCCVRINTTLPRFQTDDACGNSNAIRNDLVCFLQLISVLMAHCRKATPKRIYSGRKSSLPPKNCQGCWTAGTSDTYVPRMPRTSTFIRPQKRSFCLVFHLPRIRKPYTRRRRAHVYVPYCRERLFLQAQRLRFPCPLLDAQGHWIHHQHLRLHQYLGRSSSNEHYRNYQIRLQEWFSSSCTCFLPDFQLCILISFLATLYSLHLWTAQRLLPCCKIWSRHYPNNSHTKSCSC